MHRFIILGGNIIVKQGVYYCEIEKLYASVPLHKKIIDFLMIKKGGII